MAELKTQPNDLNVGDFLNQIENEQKRKDAFTLLEMMKKATGAEPVMWGTAIVGFGKSHYQYASGREGDWFLVGFSPRKQNFSIYLIGCQGQNAFPEFYAKLGKYKTGKSCLYINKLKDVDLAVLQNLIEGSVRLSLNKDS